ncbi:prolipoprotein diacylglyceryl transferase [Paenibacillus sp. OAS669]|uniref:prolipoprotein diacylglyceryl transferase n=1 Tax=Paenibacillus sp. OAS669 TaxID=2663821 RepID=UPI00178B5733|nr:prolipoprotein diacylglyceryl transferase family protein [Paenibacillus sp. OAS669]MBE1442987.1 prolipoprotein diacylglyceryltransferase [Paenibacillus sp. OAS669]
MTFPIWINLGFIKLHPHIVFEALAYFIGFRVYLFTRSKDKIPAEQGIWVIVGAILGAAIGSKILYWLEDPIKTIENWNSYTYLMEGKTIVGGLLGGLIGVEWVKKRVGITRSTGDDMALPIILGMAIGRIGCFMTGLDDHTYGTPTSWIVGVDFGDGIPRHPTQLYEIVFLLLLGGFLLTWKHRKRMREMSASSAFRPITDGAMFQLFMTGYLAFRLVIDFIKPTPHPFIGLNNIQLACLAGLIYYIVLLSKWLGKSHSIPKEDYRNVNQE